MTETIRGRIVQKIPPNHLAWYVEHWDGFIPGKWHVTIIKQGVPVGRIRRFLYCLWHRKEARAGIEFHVAMDSCPYKKKQLVELNVERHMIPASLYVEKKGGKIDEFRTYQKDKQQVIG